MKDYTYDESNGDVFEPYILGCQGPSLMTCSEIDASSYIDKDSHCGTGCGSELCVQEGTTKDGLTTYISSLSDGENWLEKYTMNINLDDDDKTKQTNKMN